MLGNITTKRILQNQKKKDAQNLINIKNVIQDLDIRERLRHAQNRYQLRLSPSLIFQDNSAAVEGFGKAFYYAFLFQLIPTLTVANRQEKIEADYRIKDRYLKLVNSFKSERRTMIIQFYCFLLCLTAKRVLDEIMGYTIDSTHLFQEHQEDSEKNEQILAGQIAYIFLTFHTLGIMVAVSTFSLLYNRYVRREVIKDSIFEIGNLCVSQDFLSFLKGLKKIQKTEQDLFHISLKANLAVVQEGSHLRKKRTQYKMQSVSTENTPQPIYKESFYRNQIIRGNQISSSLAGLSSFKENRAKVPSIKIFPLHSARFFDTLNKKTKRVFPIRRGKDNKKNIESSAKKIGVQEWQRRVKQMRSNSHKKLPSQRSQIFRSFERDSNQGNEIRNSQVVRKLLKVQNQRFNKEATIPIYFEKEQKIERCQMGLVTRIENYPCSNFRKQINHTPWMQKSQLKKQFKEFNNCSIATSKLYQELTVNQTLAQPRPYMGKKKKHKNHSLL